VCKPGNRFISSRYFFQEEKNSRLIQFQDGKLLYNWRKNHEETSEYPKFQNVFSGFSNSWDKLQKACKELNIKYSSNQYELVYIDHIPIEEKWNLEQYFTICSNSPFSDDLDNLILGFSSPINELKGHIHVSLKSAIRNYGKTLYLVLLLKKKNLK
jgi:uncharacterized protein (TIGR04255 family)